MITQFEFAHIFSNDQPRLEVGTGFYPRNHVYCWFFFKGKCPRKLGVPQLSLVVLLMPPSRCLTIARKYPRADPSDSPRNFYSQT